MEVCLVLKQEPGLAEGKQYPCGYPLKIRIAPPDQEFLVQRGTGSREQGLSDLEGFDECLSRVEENQLMSQAGIIPMPWKIR